MCIYCYGQEDYEMGVRYSDEFDSYELAPNRPFRVFNQDHPLGNPAEVTAFLDQGERWVSAGGPMDIEEMTAGHALNTLQLILENAQRIALVSALAEPGAHFDAEIVSGSRARTFILATRLGQALIRRASTVAETKPSWAK